MKRKIVVYVAGPFRGENHWEIAQNIRRAELVGMRLAKAGFMPLIPHANTANFHGTLDDQFWLEGTMELMSRCDAVYFDVGWELSEGCKAEMAYAKELGIPVFTDYSKLFRAAADRGIKAASARAVERSEQCR
jgi:nucleoside 2-deoxyribosyltransferase